MKVTPKHIISLNKNEIFVFGSNFPRGIHGAGAAKLAYTKFGAKWGEGYGLFGQSFAIPTKDVKINTLPIDKIKTYVDLFIEYSKTHPELIFFVTAIGTGLAGYQAKDIAPLFKEAINLPNVTLPQIFWDILLCDSQPFA